MPDRIDRTLLVIGLLTYIAGLVTIFTFGATNKSLSSVDWAHWLMLAGAVLQMPFAFNLRRNGLSVAAAVLIVTGLVCTIGMCVIDLVFWSLADDTLRSTVAGELIATPAVWSPFMLYGSEEVLYTGFVLAGLGYIAQSKAGPTLIALGAVLAIAGPSWFNVAGAVCMLAGFLLCFRAGHAAAAET